MMSTSTLREGPPQRLPTSGHRAPAAAALSAEEWRGVAGRTVLFGHQSVGGNILDGVRELAAEHAATGSPGRLRLLSGAAAETHDPAFIEFPVGQNGDPRSKAADFAAVLARAPRREGTIALYKHCYLDIGPATDAASMFREYAETLRTLHALYPALTLVHVTIPLTTLERPPERILRTLLGRSTRRELNAKRSRFNQLMREAYEGREPIFDLARMESTRPDGSRCYVVQRGDTVYALAAEWTGDGGHLNRDGSRKAAAELLALLARV
jgi:hypothetical protein